MDAGYLSGKNGDLPSKHSSDRGDLKLDNGDSALDHTGDRRSDRLSAMDTRCLSLDATGDLKLASGDSEIGDLPSDITGDLKLANGESGLEKTGDLLVGGFRLFGIGGGRVLEVYFGLEGYLSYFDLYTGILMSGTGELLDNTSIILLRGVFIGDALSFEDTAFSELQLGRFLLQSCFEYQATTPPQTNMTIAHTSRI